MQHPIGLQISDLETIPSFFEQELSIEEAEQVVGGILLPRFPDLAAADPIPQIPPKPPNMCPDSPNICPAPSNTL